MIGPDVVELTDKATIERFLRADPALHVYALGDLDDFFWPRTTWYGLRGPDGLRAVLLLYRAVDPPVVLAIEERDPPAALELLQRAIPSLPRRFYAHLSPYLVEPLGATHRLDSHGPHLKMVLADPARVLGAPLPPLPVRVVGEEDLPAMRELYRQSYPGNWFDARMLATGQYQGAFEGGEIVAVAGVHVYSERYRVAALGNVTTHPRLRGRGLGAAVTAALCRSLLRRVDCIGLNVAAGNAAALGCYEKLGFEVRAAYEETTAEG
jgi:ribosomal protein S18 acetylase RimI-like enzyme